MVSILIPLRSSSMRLSKSGCSKHNFSVSVISLFHTSNDVHSSSTIIGSLMDKWKARNRKHYLEAKEDYYKHENEIYRQYQQSMIEYTKVRRGALEELKKAEMEEERVKKLAQDAALKEELLKRMENSPRDKLDEDYFKNWERFDKYKDETDPLFKDVKRSGSDDWREVFKEKVEESKDAYEQMKHSTPFTFVNPSTESGKFGYKTVSVGDGIIYSIIAIAIGLICHETYYTYYDRKRESFK